MTEDQLSKGVEIKNKIATLTEHHKQVMEIANNSRKEADMKREVSLKFPRLNDVCPLQLNTLRNVAYNDQLQLRPEFIGVPEMLFSYCVRLKQHIAQLQNEFEKL